MELSLFLLFSPSFPVVLYVSPTFANVIFVARDQHKKMRFFFSHIKKSTRKTNYCVMS